jgi:signal transduction histidine kinase
VVEGCGVKAQNASASLERASEGARSVIEELRRSVMALYPSILDDLGLAASLSWMLRDLCKAQPGLHVDPHILLADAEVPKRLHITVFRIVQEAVNNVLKHANAKTLTVVLGGAATTVALMIRDDGCGIENAAWGKPVHSGGLVGIMRRANSSGGAFEIATGRGSGTCITVTWQQ